MRPNYSPDGLMLYREKLRSHDWSFEWSEDPRVYAKGRNELAELLVLQRDLDPDLIVWGEIKAEVAPHAVPASSEPVAPR